MFIANDYQNDIGQFNNLSDHDFMALQISQLRNIFHNEIGAIKNTKHEFVAFTKKFAEEFGLTRSHLGRTAVDLPGMDEKTYAEIEKQEKGIIVGLEFQDSIYILNRNKKLVHYVLRKRPIVNPATNNCLGIVFNTSKIVPGVFRRLLASNFLPTQKPKSIIISTPLTEQQQQVAFCLLLGFHSRKEIANILSNITKSEYSENKIKNSLQALYNKFKCNSPGQLLDLMSNGEMQIELPPVLPSGNYPMKE